MLHQEFSHLGTVEIKVVNAGQHRGTLRSWLPWLAKGSFAVADQGIFAVSNFLLNVLLVRWLAPADYGAFALAYSVFLFLLIVHNALVTAPMLVFGAGKYRERFPEYLGILLRGHFALMLPGSALLVVAAFLLGNLYSVVVERAFLALAAAAPFILLLWLLRRAFYARLNPRWAAASGGVYLIILIAGTLALRLVRLLSPSTAFLNMGLASLITCLLPLVRLQPTLTTDSPTIRTVAADHWSYGKWVAGGAGPNWVTDNIYFLLLPAWMGLAQAGALRALLNLAQPASQSISSLTTLLMPILVHDSAAGGPRDMKRTMKLCFSFLSSGSVVYLVLLWELRHQVFHFLYGGKFSAYNSWPLLLVGLLPIAQSLPNVVGAALGALEQPKLGFWSDVGGGICGIALGVPMVRALGVGGALLGILVSYMLRGILTLYFFVRSVRGATDVARARVATGTDPSDWTDAP